MQIRLNSSNRIALELRRAGKQVNNNKRITKKLLTSNRTTEVKIIKPSVCFLKSLECFKWQGLKTHANDMLS